MRAESLPRRVSSAPAATSPGASSLSVQLLLRLLPSPRDQRSVRLGAQAHRENAEGCAEGGVPGAEGQTRERSATLGFPFSARRPLCAGTPAGEAHQGSSQPSHWRCWPGGGGVSPNKYPLRPPCVPSLKYPPGGPLPMRRAPAGARMHAAAARRSAADIAAAAGAQRETEGGALLKPKWQTQVALSRPDQNGLTDYSRKRPRA